MSQLSHQKCVAESSAITMQVCNCHGQSTLCAVSQLMSYIACCWQQAPLSKTYILLALKMPKWTDVDGPASTELGTGRDWHYAAKTEAYRRRQEA